jgi:dGTPase
MGAPYDRFSETLGRPGGDDEHESRSQVAKDRDRIIHSGALRRLQRKSQIVGVQSNDFFRTRLTHTLECAQIGRGIALRSLKTDNILTVVEHPDHLPDLIEAACYAHDLGHPPFGHNGERALQEMMIAHSRSLFEGNAQSFRIVTSLEPKIRYAQRSCGLDLTRTTLKAILKYPWVENAGMLEEGAKRKFCIYNEAADLEVFAWLFAGEKPERTLATEILEISDDIAYAVHDFEDGVWAGMIPLHLLLSGDTGAVTALSACVGKEKHFQGIEVADVLAELLQDLNDAEWAKREFGRDADARAGLKNFSAKLIGEFIEQVTPGDSFDMPDPDGNGDMRRLKLDLLIAMAVVWMIKAAGQATLRYGQRRLVRDLFEGFWENPEMLPRRSDWLDVKKTGLTDEDKAFNAGKTGDPEVWRAKARLICDEVAGMTDLYALHEHGEMYGGGASPNLRLVGGS